MAETFQTEAKFSTLLTDIGGVCVNNPYIFVAEHLRRNYGIDAHHALQVMKSNARKFDGGKIGFTTFAEMTLKTLGLKTDTRIFSAVHKCGLKPKEDVVSLYRRVKRRNNVRIEAVSNMPEYTWKLIRGMKEMKGLFDAVILSYRYKSLKPDRKLFEIALQKAHATPAACLFVDDAIENVEAAADIGILSHHFSTADKLSEFLENNGLAGDPKNC
jgi:FMN phosphatase YigB (HAD superfamily)